MKAFFSIFFLLLSGCLYGQNIPAQQSQSSSEHPVVSTADSLVEVPAHLADSVLAKTRLQKYHQQAGDSLRQLSAISDSLKIKQDLDSLRQLVSAIDTLGLQRSLDSLQVLDLPLKEWQYKEDSVRQALDLSAKARKKIQELDAQLQKPLQEGQQNLQQKVDKLTESPEGLNQEAMGNLKTQSGVEISTELPVIEGLSLPETELPSTLLPKAEGAMGLDPGDLKPDLKGLSLPKTDMPDIGGTDLASYKDGLGKVDELSGEIKKADAYSEDISRLGKGKLDEVEQADKLAEKELLKREEAGFFQQQAGEAAKPVDELFKYQKEEYMKQKALDEAKGAVQDHFSEHKDKLNTARSGLNKYKGRYQEVKSVKELPKNPLKRNVLRGRPWAERWVVGSVWQFHKQDQFKIDLGPSLVYRIYDKWEIGGAYQWRLTIDKEAPLFLSSGDWLSGYSLFTDIKLKKGFFIRASAARLQLVPLKLHSSDEGPGRIWVNSYELGAGKSYTFYKNLKGYSVIQYSFSKGIDKPYKNPVQMKIGFYINGKHFHRCLKRNKSR